MKIILGIDDLEPNYRFGKISSQNRKLQIWAALVPRCKYNLIFMTFGIQNRENTLILNILFGIDNLVPNFGPTIEVLSNFMKFGTKNKCNLLTLGKFYFKIVICSLAIHEI